MAPKKKAKEPKEGGSPKKVFQVAYKCSVLCVCDGL